MDTNTLLKIGGAVVIGICALLFGIYFMRNRERFRIDPIFAQFFLKNFAFTLIFLALCFSILTYILFDTSNKTVLMETKIILALFLFFIMFSLSYILQTPEEYLYDFLKIIGTSILILFSLIAVIQRYYDSGFNQKMGVVMATVFGIFGITVYYVTRAFLKMPAYKMEKVYRAFSFGIQKNYLFLVLMTIFLFIYYEAYANLSLNNVLGDVLLPSVLAVLLVLFIFCILIYFGGRMHIINKMSIIDTFFALFAIFIFLAICCIYLFTDSISEVCGESSAEQEDSPPFSETEIVYALIFISILILLWYDDTKNWKNIGSILFIIITVFAFYCMFYYSMTNPMVTLPSLWLFIEWLITFFYKRANSVNSVHSSFLIS